MFRVSAVLVASLVAIPALAQPAACPAGMPLGSMRLLVKRAGKTPALPLNLINQLAPGDVVAYSPVLRSGEKRRGEVALVVVAAQGAPKDRIQILEPAEASKPAEWKIPSGAPIVVMVYGPSGLSAGKVEKYLERDQEMIAQLADYAEKTAQTEAVLQALAGSPAGRPTENVNAALEGFASQYGLNNKIDRNAPPDERTLAILRGINPALSSYDPISTQKQQRISGTAGLATVVAGMFLGSPVGLAAGSTALALNFKTILFPNTEFRSSFAQPAQETVALCGRQDPPQGGRTRLAYLWALRLPDTLPPGIAVDGPAFVPQTLRTPVKLRVAEPQRKLVRRLREWRLERDGTTPIPLKVTISGEEPALELDLTQANIPAAEYRLAARWDWTDVAVEGRVNVAPLSTFASARLTPASRSLLTQRGGKRIVYLEGDDFQFVEKAEIQRKGDKYRAPAPVPFSLPLGLRKGPQQRIEIEIDTTHLDAGDYLLLFTQSDGKPRPVEFKVLPDPPVVSNLPLRIPAGEPSRQLTIKGERLEQIVSIEAEGLDIKLAEARRSPERKAEIKLLKEAEPGATFDLRLLIRDYGEPVTLPGALRITAPRPRIAGASLALPSDLEVRLRDGELPAGIPVSAMLRTERAQPQSRVRLACKHSEMGAAAVIGTEQNGITVRPISTDNLFVSFDAGAWPAGCELAARIENPVEGASDEYSLGRIVRLPRIESFRLTDEPVGEGAYVGVLSGRDLEAIEKTGWDAANGLPVTSLPTATSRDGKQELRIRMSWPSPAPHSPLFIWLRGEAEGRATTVRP